MAAIFDLLNAVAPLAFDLGADLASSSGCATNTSGSGALPMDVIEREDALVVVADVAGAQREDIDVSVSNNMLRIQARKPSTMKRQHESDSNSDSENTAAAASSADQDVNVNKESASAKAPAKEKAKSNLPRYLVREIGTGTTVRTMKLGKNINTDNVTSSLKDGMLTLTFPKDVPEQPKVKRIRL